MSEISGRFGGSPDGEEDRYGPGEVRLPDPESGKWLRRHHAGGVAIVTTQSEDGFHGTTVSAWLVASIEPLQLLLSLENDNPMVERAEDFGGFVLNVLPWREQFAADQFAGHTPRASTRFVGIDHFLAPSGAPVLAGCILWADCFLADTLRTGDHFSLVGHVRAIGRGAGDDQNPLIYYLGRYHRLQMK